MLGSKHKKHHVVIRATMAIKIKKRKQEDKHILRDSAVFLYPKTIVIDQELILAGPSQLL